MIRASLIGDTAVRMIRDRVCTKCYKRPIDSEVFPNHMPRDCEKGCAIFENIEAVARIVEDAESDMSLDYDQQIRRLVCRSCNLSSTAGAYCHRRLQQTCPLSLYGDNVVRAMEPLVLERCGSD